MSEAIFICSREAILWLKQKEEEQQQEQQKQFEQQLELQLYELDSEMPIQEFNEKVSPTFCSTKPNVHKAQVHFDSNTKFDDT